MNFQNRSKCQIHTENIATVDLSKIKGKPVDAIGDMVFHIDNEEFKSPFLVEKMFGLVDVKTNAVFKACSQ